MFHAINLRFGSELFNLADAGKKKLFLLLNMPAFQAEIVFPVSHPPIINGIIITKDDGTIEALLDPAKDDIPSTLDIQFEKGVLIPGFVNAHCHLELSGLRGRLSRGRRLSGFIREFVSLREKADDDIDSMHAADKEMYDNGIVAIGDISNNNSSAEIKKNSKIYYHTFVEAFDIVPERTKIAFDMAIETQKAFRSAGLHSSIVPHAPYSVTPGLWRLIAEETVNSEGLLCMHNQETVAEDEMFEHGAGELLDTLSKISGTDLSWKRTGKSSLQSSMTFMPVGVHVQLVHNTFTGESDAQIASSNKNLFWCLCPKANLYIEERLPDIQIFKDMSGKITIGTDSYASNDSLSIFDEIMTLSDHFPATSFDNLLQWATLNGANFLKISDRFGSLEKGKNPGLNRITAFDFEKKRPAGNSSVKRII